MLKCFNPATMYRHYSSRGAPSCHCFYAEEARHGFDTATGRGKYLDARLRGRA